MTKIVYYKCFSLNLRRFIGAHGIRHISKGVHPNGKTFFIYEVTPELSSVLTTWSNNKKES